MSWAQWESGRFAMTGNTLAAVLFVLAAGCATEAAGQTRAPAAPAPPPSPYDRLWAHLTEWYDDDTNAVVQRVLFTGRYQHDYAALDADQGKLRESNVRRMRLGTRITVARRLTLHVEADVNPQERDPFLVRLTDASVAWSRSRRLVVTAGKQSVPFTLDGSTSSKELLAIDRSNLSNNLWFPQEYIPGVSVSGETGAWNYRGGVYSSGAMNRGFGEFSGGSFGLASLGYDFGHRLGVEKAALTGNYVFQRADPGNTFTRALTHVVSVHFALDAGRLGLAADASHARGAPGQSNLRAMMAMPTFNFTRAVQAVGRYTLVRSDEANGVRLTTYESGLVTGRGDRYDEFYAGASYFFYGHKLKLQTGLQWAEMRDRANDGGEYAGFAWTTGLRVGW